MKAGDEVILIVHGAGVVSEEEDHIIEEVNNKILILEDQDKIFYNKKGIYKTEVGFANFWFEIKEK